MNRSACLLLAAVLLACPRPAVPCQCPADDFTSYETTDEPVPSVPTVTVTTPFGTGTVTALRLHRLLTPADLAGNNPAAPGDNVHFAGFEAAAGTYSAATPARTFMTDLGMVQFTGGKQVRFLLDPCSKVVGPVPGPPGIGLAFLCFVPKSGTTGPKPTVSCTDQFGTFNEQLIAVAFACVAAQVGPGPAPAENWLVCLKERGPFRPPNVSLDTENFGAFPDVNLASPDEVCLAATVQ